MQSGHLAAWNPCHPAHGNVGSLTQQALAFLSGWKVSGLTGSCEAWGGVANARMPRHTRRGEGR